MQTPFIWLILLAVLAIVLFVSARRQRRQVRETQQMQNSLVEGDRVVTTSGIYGIVTDLGEDDLELEIAPDVYTWWLRAAIRQRVQGDADVDEDDQDFDDEGVDDEAIDEEVTEETTDDVATDEGARDSTEPAADTPVRSDRS